MTFTVRLPTIATAPADAAARDSDAGTAAKAAADPTPLDGISVLVVDDDNECRDMAAAHLEEHHARVLTAANAADALELLKTRQIDVLLADVAMPGEDGYSLIRKRARACSAATASIPAAALTAFAHEQDLSAALKAGFQLHLAKPIDPDALVAAVASLSRIPAALNQC